MAHLHADTACACGTRVKFKLKKPIPMHHTLAKVGCKGCGSRYLISAKAAQDGEGKRTFKTYVDFIEMSPSLREIKVG